MKKFLCVIFSLFLILFAFSIGSAAAEADTVYFTSVSVTAGERVTVPVSYKTIGGVYAVRIFIEYDQNALEFLKTENLNDAFDHTSNCKDGVITVISLARSAENITGDFQFFNIVFSVKDNAENKGYALKLGGEASVIGADGIPTGNEVVAKDGGITVVCEEHNFITPSENGHKCENCEAVLKDTSGEVFVPDPITSENVETEEPKNEQQSEPDDKTATILLTVSLALVALLLTVVIINLIKTKKEV